MTILEADLDPAEVEAAIGRPLPRPRRLGWRLHDAPGGPELQVWSLAPVRLWQPVRIPAAWIEHLEELVLQGLDDMNERLEELPLDEHDNFVAAELVGYRMLLTAGDELWISLVREGREIAAVPWRHGGDFYAALASARLTLMHFRRLPIAGRMH